LAVQVATVKKAEEGGRKQRINRSIWEGLYRESSHGERIPVIEGKPLRELLLRLEEKKTVKPPAQASRHTRTRLISFLDA
jgi:hypothetical protein